MQPFPARAVAAHDRDRTFRNAKRFGDDGNELFVRRAVHRRRVHAYEQRIAARPRNAGFSRTRHDVDADDDAAGDGFDHVR